MAHHYGDKLLGGTFDGLVARTKNMQTLVKRRD